MLKWSLSFLLIAIVAGLLGFTTIAGVSIEIAKILFFIFLVLFILSLFVGGAVIAMIADKFKQ